MAKAKEKEQINFRPRPHDMRAIEFLMGKLGLNLSNVLRYSIHRCAESEGMKSMVVGKANLQENAGRSAAW